MKSSLHAQSSAVDVMATQARQRGNLKMQPEDWEMLEPRLAAACMTLRLLDANRHRLPADLLADIEGDA